MTPSARFHFLLALLIAPLQARYSHPSEVYDRTVRGVAWVQAGGQGKGTGWVVDRGRRWLITSYHVVGENATAEVVFPLFEGGQLLTERSAYLERLPALREKGLAVRGRVLRRDPARDLALVELPALPASVKALPLAQEPLKVEGWGHVVGNRYDVSCLWTYTGGAVRDSRVLREGYFNGGRQLAKGARVVKADAPINEGDSGAPLVNDAGAVAGVAAAVAWEDGGKGLFIDLRELRAFLESAGWKPPAQAAPPLAAAEPDGLSNEEIYYRAMQSLVLASAPDTDRRAAGVIIDVERRLVLTTAEVIGEAKVLDVSALGQGADAIPALVLAVDPRRNLALLDLPSLPPNCAALVHADPPDAGDEVHALTPPGKDVVHWRHTRSFVRQRGHADLGRKADAGAPEVLFLQTPTSKEAGGSPVLNLKGELVAVLTGKQTAQQVVSYALTVAEVEAFLDECRPRLEPRTAAEWIERGTPFVQARQLERAAEVYSAALDSNPADARLWAERARVYHLLGLDAKALADCGRALELDARLASAHVVRAAVRCDRGELKQARADCDTALKIDRTLSDAYRVRARAHRLGKDLEAALRDADDAIWHDRKSAPAHLERGLTLLARNDLRDASAAIDRALLLDPQLAEAYLARAECHWRRGDVSAGVADIRKGVEIEGGQIDSAVTLLQELYPLWEKAPQKRERLKRRLQEVAQEREPDRKKPRFFLLMEELAEEE